jgi:hypothetical protein
MGSPYSKKAWQGYAKYYKKSPYLVWAKPRGHIRGPEGELYPDPGFRPEGVVSSLSIYPVDGDGTLFGFKSLAKAQKAAKQAGAKVYHHDVAVARKLIGPGKLIYGVWHWKANYPSLSWAAYLKKNRHHKDNTFLSKLDPALVRRVAQDMRIGPRSGTPSLRDAPPYLIPPDFAVPRVAGRKNPRRNPSKAASRRAKVRRGKKMMQEQDPLKMDWTKPPKHDPHPVELIRAFDKIALDVAEGRISPRLGAQYVTDEAYAASMGEEAWQNPRRNPSRYRAFIHGVVGEDAESWEEVDQVQHFVSRAEARRWLFQNAEGFYSTYPDGAIVSLGVEDTRTGKSVIPWAEIGDFIG